MEFEYCLSWSFNIDPDDIERVEALVVILANTDDNIDSFNASVWLTGADTPSGQLTTSPHSTVHSPHHQNLPIHTNQIEI